MANSFGSNPIVLDDFTAAIDIGDTLFGNSKALFIIEHIEWQEPTAADDTATITNEAGQIIFNETCPIAKASVLKDFCGQAIKGIKIGAGAVETGSISILLTNR